MVCKLWVIFQIDMRSFSELEQLFLKINAKCDSGFVYKKTEANAARVRKDSLQTFVFYSRVILQKVTMKTYYFILYEINTYVSHFLLPRMFT